MKVPPNSPIEFKEKICILSARQHHRTHLIEIQLLTARALFGDPKTETIHALGGTDGRVVEGAGRAHALGAADHLIAIYTNGRMH